MTVLSRCGWVYAVAILSGIQVVHGQSIFGTNLIINGNAEAGPAGTSTTQAASIPGWMVTANVNVLPYGPTSPILLTDPAPPDHGFQYFTGITNGSATLTQTINVSSAASAISGGNVKFTAAAYLGSTIGGGWPTQVTFAFQNAAGQTFNTATLGPVSFPQPVSLFNSVFR